LWLALFQYSMIVIVQEICARIGPTTGSGLAAVRRKRYKKNSPYDLYSHALVQK